jgi:drug/metabolite transporter (DMT)-like permease
VLVTRVQPHWLGIGLLVIVTVIWGTTFPILKNAVERLTPAELIASRFLVAALALSPWLFRVPKKLWLEGGLIAVVLFISYVTQVIGLTSVSSSRAAFITGLNVILVPMFLPFLRKRVPPAAFFAAALALGGIAIMSLEGLRFSFSIGDVWVLGCAISYAAYIIMVDRVVAKYDPLPLAAVQVAVVALLGLAWALPNLIAQPPTQAVLENWLPIVYLGLIATAVTTLAQSFAQRFVPAFQTAVIYALEPVFAAIFSFWWLREMLTAQALIGAGLILVAMVVSQIDFGGADRAEPRVESV